VADRSQDPELRQVARMRLARVLVEQGKHDDALALLDPAAGGAFASLVHELRGDALAAKGDASAARKEYEAALEGAAADGSLDREFVELKRDALPAAPAALAGPAPAAPRRRGNPPNDAAAHRGRGGGDRGSRGLRQGQERRSARRTGRSAALAGVDELWSAGVGGGGEKLKLALASPRRTRCCSPRPGTARYAPSRRRPS